jgi:hypothetical protein
MCLCVCVFVCLCVCMYLAPSFHGKWQRRFFVLQDSILYYYKGLTKASPQGIIRLEGARFERADDEFPHEKGYPFLVGCSWRMFYFYASSDMDRIQWLEAIGEEATGGVGKRKRTSIRKTLESSAAPQVGSLPPSSPPRSNPPPLVDRDHNRINQEKKEPESWVVAGGSKGKESSEEAEERHEEREECGGGIKQEMTKEEREEFHKKEVKEHADKIAQRKLQVEKEEEESERQMQEQLKEV